MTDIQLINIKPTIENVIPYKQFIANNPRIKNIPPDSDQQYLPILYGGGRDYILSLLTDNVFDSNGNTNNCSGENVQCDLFILDSHLIIWFDLIQLGLQIPYSKILYHGYQIVSIMGTNKKSQLVLSIDIEKYEDKHIIEQLFPGKIVDLSGSIEFLLDPLYFENDRHYSLNGIENLFTFSNFGLNRGNNMVTNCNTVLSERMEYVDQQSDDLEDEESLDMYGNNNNVMDYSGLLARISDNNNTIQGYYDNSGYGDDLNNQAENNTQGNAGFDHAASSSMSMQFYSNSKIAGNKRHESG
ncbi:uncharacterized protein SCODWIG_00857 [Saccharomycodes ludwigii]|uniref:Protein LOT5 n=1 Tax=Saccharomycodes ludwigii TaxID=36035 RepID=A0A376B335_9ASCO|nr:hypothetical protein SCDLUD_004287 [Saccharomycodes ludwigii]KAH3899971.1 hypothetical protein SCDLUD_004287 [Saccharomycodes ludwigii]SSD59096.1 uncharacterized protein SCODWIG_00857 [Saccharomycodes ludwigii]